MVKQVIAVRTDLDMPIGRIPAQVAHASIAVFLNMGEWEGNTFTIKDISNPVKHWMKESFTKVVVKVHSKEELEKLARKARDRGLLNVLISDNIGKTFHTMALAIGPATSEEIDPITKHLKLF